VARLTAAPPETDREPGRHQVTAEASGGHRSQAVNYTVQPGPTNSPTFRTTPTPGSSTDAAVDPTDGSAVLPPQAAPPTDSASAAVLGVTAQNADGGGLPTAFLVMGGLLVLGGFGIFGLIIYWMRRGDGDGIDRDTEVIPE
jgi:hypothetical protein